MIVTSRYLQNVFISLVFICAICFSQSIVGQTYGLKFNSQEVTLDKRTELDLTPEGYINLQDEFEISFDYKTTRIKANSSLGFFGYIFRIINKEDKNIDLLSTPTPRVGLNMVIGKSNRITPIDYSENYINNWINLRVKFMLEQDRLIFYTPDTFFVHDDVGFKKKEQFKIFFGVNDFKQFKNSDVPSMTIKDIKISEKGKLKYHWPLNEKEGNVAIDRIKKQEAHVFNPSWVVLNHQNWQNVFEFEMKDEITLAIDEQSGDIFALGREELLIYSVLGNNVSKTKYKNSPLFFNRNYRAIYNPIEKRIYCYLVEEGSLYWLDIETATWNEGGNAEEIETRFRHHNSYFNVQNNSIYLFGGYGLHRYNNELVKLDVKNRTWTDLSVDENIYTPRYLSGLSELNDTIYIIGGYGSASGDQLINPQSCFDLLGYSLADGKWFKKFDLPRLIDDMIVGNSFWIDKNTRNYYALIFSKIKFDNELQLVQGNLDSPELTLVGDKIPFNFLDIRSKVGLFYMPVRNKLYTYSAYTSDTSTKVAIYSIENPPNAQNGLMASARKKSNIKLYFVLVLLIIAAVVLVVVIRKKNGVKKEEKNDSHEHGDKSEVELVETTIPTVELPKYNLIFFGGFQVFNKDSEDITNKFSPLLKELFLLILLHTFKNDKGISSDKITEVLWYDKSEKSARNNRSVNMAKLRLILEEIGACELSKKTGYWKLNFEGTKISGDYFDFLNIVSSKNNLSKQIVNKLIKITHKGAFLSNVHYDWLDHFKAFVSDTIVDTLVEFGQTCDVKQDADFIIHLADSIFNFDMINEDAMILKCKAQYCLGKHSLAKATYQKFFKEYTGMYGQEYEQSFLEILEIKE